jgi:XTP/dITP diphosphohydrolase
MTPIEKLLVATGNPDKVAEIGSLVAGLGIDVLDLSSFPEFPEVEETGTTLEENALLKAREAAAHTGLPSLADDTGLFVDALDGAPGVYSSRFAGPGASYDDNCSLLLERMKDVPLEERTARFICVVSLVVPEMDDRLFRGEVEGLITRERRGSSGFGYDPVFYHPPSGRTFAEMRPDEKNALSHRFIAVRKAVRYLQDLTGEGTFPAGRRESSS